MREFIVSEDFHPEVKYYPDLIRCRDCRFYKQNKYGKGYCIGSCDVLGFVDSNWFCADGERKEGDGDDKTSE